MTSKADYDLNPLEDLPPPSYAQATANTSRPASSDAHRSVANPQNSQRPNGIKPSMEVAGARASMAAAQDAASKANVMNSGNRQYGGRSNEYVGSQGQNIGLYPDRGGMGGPRLGHGPGGRIIGHMGERLGINQGPQQVHDGNGPNQMYGSEGMYDRNYHGGNGLFVGPPRGGYGLGARGGGLLGRGGGLLGMGGSREGRRERRSARREARWERRAF